MDDQIYDMYHRLRRLGVSVSDLHQDYNKIPLENIELAKVEREPPNKSKLISKHNIVVDSRQRDYTLYPDPNSYLVNLLETYRNVEKIELIAAMVPKTEYNVNSENNLLLLTIGGVQQALYLNIGQYLVGSNTAGSINYVANGNVPLDGLIAEMVRVLNTHVNSAGAFNVFLATLPPSNNGTGSNASVLNRIVITNSAVAFSIDFTCTGYTAGGPFRLMGFKKAVYNSAIGNTIYGSSDTGVCSSATLEAQTVYALTINSLTAVFDYDLIDDPKYLIMQLEFGNKSADRVQSIDIATNQKFAMIIYDANEPDNIQTYDSNTSVGGNVTLQTDRRPGRLKALKGSDFDKKILEFDPPLTLENFKISFFKYDNTLYDFHGREHMLIFEIDIADFDPKYRI